MSGSKDILDKIFGVPKGKPNRVPVIRGRSDIRRPERAKQAGYLGRGYSGPDGRMAGQWQSGEEEVPELPGREKIYEFEDIEDLVLSMVIVAFMHANPGMGTNEAVEAGSSWMRKYGLAGKKHLWRKQMQRIDRRGIRAEASKIRRELYRLL